MRKGVFGWEIRMEGVSYRKGEACGFDLLRLLLFEVCCVGKLCEGMLNV